MLKLKRNKLSVPHRKADKDARSVPFLIILIAGIVLTGERKLVLPGTFYYIRPIKH